jgi:hypothetical protein
MTQDERACADIVVDVISPMLVQHATGIKPRHDLGNKYVQYLLQ